MLLAAGQDEAVQQPGHELPKYPGGPDTDAPAHRYVPYGYRRHGRPPGESAMAVLSLIFGIGGFLCITPFFGLGWGVAALLQMPKTGQTGKWKAVVGTVLSASWIVLIIVILLGQHQPR